MSLETFLEGVRAELATDLAITVKDGYIEGPLDVEMGCVYPGDTTELEENVDVEELEIFARVFKPVAQQFVPEEPPDNSELLAARDAIIAALKDKQTATWGVWYLRIRGFEIDAQERHVTARITAWHTNPFAT